MTGTTHTSAQSSSDFDVDAVLAALVERQTSTSAPAASVTDEVDALLTRALDEVGLTGLIQPPVPALVPTNHASHEASERVAAAIAIEPTAAPRLLELSPTTEGVYALWPSTVSRRARPFRQLLERLTEHVLAIWVAAIVMVAATVVLWTRDAGAPLPSTAAARTADPATTPSTPVATRPLDTGNVGSAPEASARPRQPLATSADVPSVDASRASRAPIARSAPSRSGSAVVGRAQHAPALAAPTRAHATDAKAPPLAERPASPPSTATRAATANEIGARSIGPLDLIPPATADATEPAIPANVPIAEPPSIDVAAATPNTPAGSASSVSRPSRPPTILARVQPVYPPLARSAGIQGAVQVEIALDDRGQVVRMAAKTGPEPLRAAAEAAVRQWRFAPALVNGVPQAGSGSVTVVFRLQ